MISGPSILNALLIYSLMLATVCVLRKVTPLLIVGGGSALMLLACLAAVRLILPFEIPSTHTVRPLDFLGALYKFFRSNPAVTYGLLVIWAIGTAVVIVRYVISLRRAYAECREYMVVESERTQEIVKRSGVNCPVLVSPYVEVPYVVGIFRHTIYLPFPEMSERDTEMILKHEVQHIRSHHALVKLFFGLLSAAVWWNFLGGPFRKAIDALLEFLCDKKVTKGMSEGEKSDYLTALANAAERVVSNKRTPALAMNESFALRKRDTVLKQRFRVIDESRKRKRPHILGAIAKCGAVALFVVSYLFIIQPAIAPSEEAFQNDSKAYYVDDYDGPNIGNEATSTFIIKGSDGRYQLYINYEFNRYLTEDEVVSDKFKNSYIFEEDRQK